MGKRNNKAKGSGYSHKQTYNKAARESDDRRAARMSHMTVTRLRKVVDKQQELMRYYIPVSSKKKVRLDPNFNLKGAARPALDFYKDPNFDYSEPEGVNLLEQYSEGKMWQHAEGQKLLEAKLELGVALHNIASKSKDAIATFKSILELDTGDHLRARHALLRCYMDEGMGLEARALIEQFPEDHSACFTFGLALLDHVAHHLNEEEGCTLEAANHSLTHAFTHNNYAAWVIALHHSFSECVELTEELLQSVSTEPGEYCEGGILDALLFFTEDAQIWTDTDGAVEWVRDFLKANVLQFTNPGTLLGVEVSECGSDDEGSGNGDEAPSLVTVATTTTTGKRKLAEEEDEEDECVSECVSEGVSEGMDDAEKKADAEIMYLNMYRTAAKMAAAGVSECESKDDSTAAVSVSVAVAEKLLEHLHTLPIFDNFGH